MPDGLVIELGRDLVQLRGAMVVKPPRFVRYGKSMSLVLPATTFEGSNVSMNLHENIYVHVAHVRPGYPITFVRK